jgi:hypothetical protein
MPFEVAWHLTKREWLSLNPEQKTLAYHGNVTSMGKDDPSPSPYLPPSGSGLGTHGRPIQPDFVPRL